MKYVKLKLTFGDKIRFLFLGVIPEHVLPSKNLEPLEPLEPIMPFNERVKEHEINNDVDNELNNFIPFFDGTDDTKSNF